MYYSTWPLVINPNDTIGFSGALVVRGFLVWQTRQRETYLSMADQGTQSYNLPTSAKVFFVPIWPLHFA